MPDPMASVYARLDWTRAHIEHFFRVAAFQDPDKHTVVTVDYPERGELILRMSDPEPNAERLGLIAGDAFHNLRAALDGAFAVVSQHFGVSGDVSFPLRRSPEGFAEMHSPESRLPERVWAALEHFQPYDRGEVLRIIHDLDITHKHRTILVTAEIPASVMFLTDETIYPTVCVGPIEQGAIYAKIRFAPRSDVPKIDSHTIFDVVFNEPGDSYGRSINTVLTDAYRLIRYDVVPVLASCLT